MVDVVFIDVVLQNRLVVDQRHASDDAETRVDVDYSSIAVVLAWRSLFGFAVSWLPRTDSERAFSSCDHRGRRYGGQERRRCKVRRRGEGMCVRLAARFLA